jgi:serine protease
MKKLILLALFIAGIWFALANFQGLATNGNYDSLVIDFREDIGETELEKKLSTIEREFNQKIALNSIFSIDDRIYTLKGDRQALDRLRRELKSDVEYIEPNYLYYALETPNDPDYSKQWNFRSINLEQAWDDSKGEGITVAVIDTGVSAVPDLADTQMVEGYDFVNDRKNASDDVGHGTHVAGTIAQSTNNNYGVAGIAYKATIMPIKVLSGGGGGTISDIAEGIKFAADNGAKIINMSLGGGGDSQLMREAIDYANKKGTVIIAAAGNENRNSSSYPARYPNVISVAAIDASGKKAPYSNFGAGVDISAPGGSETGKILQNTIDSKTGESIFVGYQGTSMASPHVAGVAALIASISDNNPENIRKILLESTRKINEDPLNHYGAGQLDAAAAVKLTLKGQITFRDFFRWLRDNGYLNPRFWIDGGTIALLPKILMVVGSYVLAWVLRNYLPMGWNWSLTNGMVFGSCGLFFLKGFYIFDLPQWPFRVLGSSIVELGNTIQGTQALNPFFASVLIPFLLVVVLLGHQSWKWFAIGSCLGVASCLGVTAFMSPNLWLLGGGSAAIAFLGVNALLCLALAYLAVKRNQGAWEVGR